MIAEIIKPDRHGLDIRPKSEGGPVRRAPESVPMTTEQIHLVRKSFAELRGKETVASLIFYRRLFELAPEVRPLFHTDIEEQGRKLMDMLGFALSRLEKLPELEAALEGLGARHTGYGATAEHYPVVGRALLDMLAETLGRGFTPAVREAWTALYGFCAAAILRGPAAAGRTNRGTRTVKTEPRPALALV